MSELKSRWMGLADIERARAVDSLRSAGASIRAIGRYLGFSESNLRHLLEALDASSEDQELAEHRLLSTRELVRRARTRKLRQDAEQRELLRFQQTEAAEDGADLI